MKTALVHDWLLNFGGAERVLESIYELYPSPVFTLLKNEDNVRRSQLANADIHTSFLQKMPLARAKYRLFLPFFPKALEQFDFSGYDVVISSSHAVAKGVITSPDTLHISYTNGIMQYLWGDRFYYLGGRNGIFRLLANHFSHKIRLWDVVSSGRVDYFIANSRFMARQIMKLYRREAEVIYPPVAVDYFDISYKKEDYYLAVSRLVEVKKVELLVNAFNCLPEKRLVIIGGGPLFSRLKSIAKKNIELIGLQEKPVVRDYMRAAKAYMFPSYEPFGIASVEAQACGTPVIAYRKGGSVETVIDNKTGLFFEEQTADSVIAAVRKFEREQDMFDCGEIRRNAERFGKERFQRELRNFVEEKKQFFFGSRRTGEQSAGHFS